MSGTRCPEVTQSWNNAMLTGSAWREGAELEIPHAQPRPHPAGSRPYVPDPVAPDAVEPHRRTRRPRSGQPPLVMILAPVLGLAMWAGIIALLI